MNKIKEIRFKVLHSSALIDPDRQTHIAVTGQKEHVWVTGLGPCGREVVELSYSVTLAALTIRQVSHPKGFSELSERAMELVQHTTKGPKLVDELVAKHYALLDDRKVEQFVYKLEDIVGRIRAIE